MLSKIRIPPVLEIVLNAPIGPQRLRDDTVVIDVKGWYRTLTPSAKTFSAANEILFCNLNQHNPEQQIDDIIAEYHQRGLTLSWCVYPWTQPADLGSRLLARGANSIKIRAHLVNTALPLQVVDGVDVERINLTDNASFEAYFSILFDGYHYPPDEDAFRRTRYRQLCSGDKPIMQLFIARYKGEAVGCTGMMIKENSAHLTTGSVLPAFQARGIFQSLIATQLATLRDMDIPLATGHSNEKSTFWLERFGFKRVFSYDIYELEPPVVNIKEGAQP